MEPKLIGVTARILTENNVRKQFVNERYLVAMHKQGFNTIMLTMDNPNIDAILDMCDGFLVTGGSDVNPQFFGEENTGESKNIDASMDNLDRAVVLYAAKHKKPILGICRGHQTINVFLGGSLFQDIGKAHESTKHQVTSTTNRILPFPKNFETNSYHHQAINQLAPDFEIIALAEDGTIEAIIHQTLPIVGIQWHPEMIQEDINSQLIFTKFKELVTN